MPTPQFKVYVDWNKNGSFADANEDISADVRFIRTSRGLSDLLGRIVTGQCDLILNNAGGKYSPDNSSSPLAGNLKPFREIKIEAIYDSTTYAMFRGFIVRYEVEPNQGRGNEDQRVVHVFCADRFKVLGFKKTTTGLLTDVKYDAIITTILDDIGVGPADRDIAPTWDTTPFASFSQRDAINALADVIAAGQFTHFIAPDGKYTMRNRYWGIEGTVEATYSSTLVEFQPEYDEDDIENYVQVRSQPRKKSSTIEIVFNQTSPIQLSSGQVVTLFCEYTDPTIQIRTPIAAAEMVTPLAGTDYLGNTASDGSGTDKTSALTVVTTFFGETAKVVITNTDAGAVWVTKLQLRGKPVRPQSTILREASDAPSQTMYQKRDLLFENNLIAAEGVAQDLASYLLAQRKDVVPAARMRLRSVWPDQLARNLGSIIIITDTNTGVNYKHYITGIEHLIRDEGFTHETIYRLRKWIDFGWFVLDVSQLDVRKLAY